MLGPWLRYVDDWFWWSRVPRDVASPGWLFRHHGPLCALAPTSKHPTGEGRPSGRRRGLQLGGETDTKLRGKEVVAGLLGTCLEMFQLLDARQGMEYWSGCGSSPEFIPVRLITGPTRWRSGHQLRS